MYGWMAPNVKAVELRIDLDLENAGRAPSVQYTVRVSRIHYLLERLTTHLSTKTGIWAKLQLFAALTLGAPRPNQTDATIRTLAQSLLPKGVQVKVDVKPY